MISGPIVDGFYFWRRRSRLKRKIIAENIRHNSWSKYVSCKLDKFRVDNHLCRFITFHRTEHYYDNSNRTGSKFFGGQKLGIRA